MKTSIIKKSVTKTYAQSRKAALLPKKENEDYAITAMRNNIALSKIIDSTK